ncbi:MAG: hypothetical protein AVDCRST_MAG74-30 [uncultured Pyrinomonadaceae bacterium]|uniref:PDZ domain-containing protein n=1 Tax=uncultured Pyrinomonadaceae bacterium TaxID=2283094 RepID=A0A6J4N705_9BACT|nr:MAG: hypothetical protein AVDCRST_MAG74-30 [uncultured Pyrinomonadaceae bacterium]
MQSLEKHLIVGQKTCFKKCDDSSGSFDGAENSQRYVCRSRFGFFRLRCRNVAFFWGTNDRYVSSLHPHGAAEKAGVLIGDVLLSIDDTPTLEPTDVQAALRGKEAGNTVKAKLLRGGELTEIEIVLGERPARDSGEHRRECGGRGWRRRGC